jgi:hypothetical protein
METIKTTARIHPLMAAAAVSVIVVSLAGAAAITGLLPSSHSAPQPAASADQAAPYAATQPLAPLPGVPADAGQPQSAAQGAYGQAAPAAYAQAMPANYVQPAPAAYVQPAPTVIKETVIREVPAKPAHAVRHHASYAHNDAPRYYEPAPRPAPAPAQPNYVAIGTGAVVGGLIGNQVGHGNGRKLATIAGLIGGGFLGNQIANQNR